MWRCCLNPRVIAGVAGAGVLLWLYMPTAAAGALPALILLVCPLSMGIMAWRMRSGGACSATSSTAASATSIDTELRELTEEVAILRAQRRLSSQADRDPI
jgi:hypothetical protein